MVEFHLLLTAARRRVGFGFFGMHANEREDISHAARALAYFICWAWLMLRLILQVFPDFAMYLFW